MKLRPPVILCSERELRGYKRRAARAFPKEYLELMFGTVSGQNITIEKLVYVPQVATRLWVNWKSDDHYEDVIAATEAQHGFEFIGTIHSHTLNHDGAEKPSYADNDSAHAWDEQVFAIDLIAKAKSGKYRHDVHFYRTQKPLEEVGYF